MTAHPVIAAPPASVRVTLPLRTCTEGNAKEHWRTKARRAQQQRQLVRLVLPMHLRTCHVPAHITFRPIIVTLTRIAPSKGLDPHDNLPGSLKHVVDEVASCLGLDDRDPRVTWMYEQRRGSRKDLTLALGFGVCVEIAGRP